MHNYTIMPGSAREYLYLSPVVGLVPYDGLAVRLGTWAENDLGAYSMEYLWPALILCQDWRTGLVLLKYPLPEAPRPGAKARRLPRTLQEGREFDPAWQIRLADDGAHFTLWPS